MIGVEELEEWTKNRDVVWKTKKERGVVWTVKKKERCSVELNMRSEAFECPFLYIYCREIGRKFVMGCVRHKFSAAKS